MLCSADFWYLDRNIWVCFGLVAVGVFVSGLALAVTLGFKPSVNKGYPEAGFLATLSLSLSSLLALYTIYLNITLRRALALRNRIGMQGSSALQSPSSDNPTRVNDLRLVGVICVVTFFFHAVYLLVLDVSAFNSKIQPRWVYTIIFFFYVRT